MKRRKRARERGRLRLSKVFQEFKEGDLVSLNIDLGAKGRGFFPKQFHGLTGIIEAKQGDAYIVKFKNGGVYKRLVVKPVHLKKLEG